MKRTVCLFILSVVTFGLATGCGSHMAPSNATSTTAPSPTPPVANPNAKTIAAIEALGGWENCTSCTGNPFAVYSMKQGIAAPSLSGSSARFQLLSGTKPFGAALWFKFLGAHDDATHFVYDLSFLADNPEAAQALEFNVSQSTGGSRYSFATQCDLAGTHTWRVWDPGAQRWADAAVPCSAPAANTWNHLTWEFERDQGGNTVFTAVTLNGIRSTVNLSMGHTADSSSGIDVGFQLDAVRTATPYSVWLDRISLTYW
ncbi:MAG TPA: hypothetical protein VE783_10430 [Candidatus Limnocylindrales bacterium]|nr:hypothetical protein [Candidatus Limnocylindrales bacterium]